MNSLGQVSHNEIEPGVLNANFHASVTLLFLFGFSLNFHQNVELRNWE